MAPRLLEGDSIHIEPVRAKRLAPGDVIVFASESAGFVVHRLIWRTRPLGEPTVVYTKGDALDHLDRRVTLDRVIGRVVGVVRGEELTSPTTWVDRVRCVMLAAGYGARLFVRRALGIPSGVREKH